MKLSAIIAAGCLVTTLGMWTPAEAAQQPSPKSPAGTSQAGSGSGVDTDPATQGTTDRAGQTPRPSGTAGQPTGSILPTDRHADEPGRDPGTTPASPRDGDNSASGAGSSKAKQGSSKAGTHRTHKPAAR